MDFGLLLNGDIVPDTELPPERYPTRDAGDAENASGADAGPRVDCWRARRAGDGVKRRPRDLAPIAWAGEYGESRAVPRAEAVRVSAGWRDSWTRSMANVSCHGADV